MQASSASSVLRRKPGTRSLKSGLVLVRYQLEICVASGIQRGLHLRSQIWHEWLPAHFYPVDLQIFRAMRRDAWLPSANHLIACVKLGSWFWGETSKTKRIFGASIKLSSGLKDTFSSKFQTVIWEVQISPAQHALTLGTMNIMPDNHSYHLNPTC